MNTTENNKLIAEFMGIDVATNKEHYFMPPSLQQKLKLELYCNICSPSIIQFHSSWDWLMPVIDTIEKSYDTQYVCLVPQHEKDTKYQFQIFISNTNVNSNNKIDCYYKAVVEFIKWYNENNL